MTFRFTKYSDTKEETGGEEGEQGNGSRDYGVVGDLVRCGRSWRPGNMDGKGNGSYEKTVQNCINRGRMVSSDLSL